MMTPEGRIEIFRYTKRYILEHYRAKSLRCKPCVHFAACEGMHINYIRAHGYSLMQPVGATSRRVEGDRGASEALPPAG
jgi:hypothetical protein